MFSNRALALLFSAAFVALAAPAVADDLPSAATVMQKVQDNTYFPKAQGLKDITLTIDYSMLAGLGGEVLIQYMWKSPDKEALVVKGLEDNPMLPPAAMGPLKKQFKQIGRMCVGEGIQDRLKGYDVTVSKDGDHLVLTGKTADAEQMFSEITYWISPAFEIVKQKQKLATPQPGQSESEQTYTLAKRDGKTYAVASSQPDGTKITIDWAEVGGIFMPTKMNIESPRNPMGPMTMEFKDVKVNTGLDDSLFTEAPKAAPTNKP